MLNGIAPILIFEFSKTAKAAANNKKIPVVSSILSKLPLPFIPIYLDEQLTGLVIDTEELSMEVDTSTETLTISDTPEQNQRGINNTIKIAFTAKRDSIGLLLLTAMGDLIFPKVTSKEYAITYMHGSIIVLHGLLHAFSISQNTGNDLCTVNLELVRIGIVQKQPPTEIPNKSGVSLLTGKVPGA